MVGESAAKGRALRALGQAPVALTAVAGLAVAVWAGLVRIGWAWEMPLEDLPAMHGAIMVCGFLGTVIGIERAVALGRWWAWASPALAAAGAVALVAGLPGAMDSDPSIARALFAASAVALFAESLLIVRRQPALFTATLAAGAGALAAGNIAWWMERPLSHAVLWWIGFLVLTIASERLELSRVVRLSRRAVVVFAAEGLLLLGSLAWTTWKNAVELRCFGIALALLALWMLRCDVARRTVKLKGLPRFVASGLLAGYAWLLAGGVIFAWYATSWGPFPRDAAYHSVFLGFVISMIFAHAPIILPAISGLEVAWSRLFYVPLFFLHATLVVRVAADFGPWMEVRQWGGLGNAASIALFLLVLLSAVVRAALAKRRTARRPTSSA